MLPIIITIAQILGVLSSISALLTTRTSQGAIAWIVSLNTFPYLAVPLYWVFGRTRFNGYVQGRKDVDAALTGRVGHLRSTLTEWKSSLSHRAGGLASAERLAKLPFTHGNRVELLVNGPEAFSSMFDAIRCAQRYILVQFYIVRHDRLGMELQTLLLEASSRGVNVYMLYDEIGSHALSTAYIKTLRAGGVRIVPFMTTRGRHNRFQINFRNHRKILVVDGVDGFLGGLNVGDEYLGLSPSLGSWRDTHLHIQGPALVGLQLPFVEDWHWATGEYLFAVDWSTCLTLAGQPARHTESSSEEAEHPDRTLFPESTVLILPSGPADDYATASLMVQHAIHAARERLWIASPYFVPDEAVQDALTLAVLRGVDVRILVPDRPDHLLVYLSMYALAGPLLKAGVRILRYTPGFMHQKVVLVDNDLAAVGTVNLDNRSFRLNFEITGLVLGRSFAHAVQAMLEHDFSCAREMNVEEIERAPIWMRLASRLAYLTAPVQ